MGEKIKVSQEQLPPTRRAVDKAMGLGNIVEGVAIVGGVIFASTAAVVGGVVGLASTWYIRENHLKWIPKEKANKPPRRGILFRRGRRGS